MLAAALMTSQMSIPILWQATDSSLTRAMLTLRKMFSRSLVISATLGEPTWMTRSTKVERKSAATSLHLGVTPPTTFGMLLMANSRLPGSMRSGEKAR